MTEQQMTRAERRRAAREKEWVGHDPEVHQSLDPLRQLQNHTAGCARCASGTVAQKGCPWLYEFAAKNPGFIADALGVMEGNGQPDV